MVPASAAGASSLLPPAASLGWARLPASLTLKISMACFFAEREDRASGRPWTNHEMNQWVQPLTVCREHPYVFVLAVRKGQARLGEAQAVVGFRQMGKQRLLEVE